MNKHIAHIVKQDDFNTWNAIQRYYIKKGFEWSVSNKNGEWISNDLARKDILLIFTNSKIKLIYMNRIKSEWEKYNIQPFNVVPEELFKI